MITLTLCGWAWRSAKPVRAGKPTRCSNYFPRAQRHTVLALCSLSFRSARCWDSWQEAGHELRRLAPRHSDSGAARAVSRTFSHWDLGAAASATGRRAA